MSAWRASLAASPVGAVVTLLGGLRATLFAAAAMVFLALYLWQSWQLGREREQNADAAGKISVWQQADTDNKRAIKALTEANRVWSEAWAADVSAGALAAQRWQSDKDRLAGENQKLRQQLERVYAKDPNARKWAGTGIPAGVADGLLDAPVSGDARRNR